MLGVSCGLQGAAVVGPAEWLRFVVVVACELDDLVGEVFPAGELAAAQYLGHPKRYHRFGALSRPTTGVSTALLSQVEGTNHVHNTLSDASLCTDSGLMTRDTAARTASAMNRTSMSSDSAAVLGGGCACRCEMRQPMSVLPRK